MADYISTLSGVQMDAALMDMAEHNSEAYAVGERNGNPVGADDVTYHNNARYYAQQAQSIAPASVTEAVRWDVAQTALTDANKEMARANIDAGKNGAWTNPNLLDNPFFTINQRNVANGVHINANGFVADRWQATGTIGATRNSDGSLTIADTLFHKLPTDLELAWKTVTLSVLYADGTTEANTFPWSGTSTKYFTYGRAVVYSSAYQINFNSFTKDVKAFKLELGSVSTLANDTPPELSIARIPCYENFLRLKGAYAPVGYAIAVSTTLALVVIPTPVTMRALPSASLSGTLYFNAGTPFAVTGLASNGTTLGVNQITQQVTGSFEVGKVYLAQFRDATSYLDLSADL